MNFRQFAYRNVTRNKRTYVAYFLSSMFTVMVFFAFLLFAFHPTFETINSSVRTGLLTSGGIIYVFSFFYILYSMSTFLQSRKREFGLLMMLGASNKQIKAMVFIENLLIGTFSTLFGIGLGLLFAKTILLVAENVLIIDERLHFYVPFEAIFITLVSFLALFVVISLFVAFVLRTSKLVALIKGDQTPKKEPKASIFLSVLAALLLVIGYVIALTVKGVAVVMALIPVVIIVMIGTYFFFTQLSVFIVRFLKRRDAIFYKRTNILLFSDLSFRLKDNARTFFMVAMISTVAFSAIGTLFGLHSYLTEGVIEINPYSISYKMDSDDQPEVMAEEVAYIDQQLTDMGLESSSETIDVAFVDMNEGYIVPILKESDYNKAAKLIGEPTLDVKTGEAIIDDQTVAMISDGPKASETLLTMTIDLEGGHTLIPAKVIQTNVFSSMNGSYVINDEDYAKLPKASMNRTSKQVYWMTEDLSRDEIVELGEALEDIPPYRVAMIDYTVFQIERGYGPALFVGLFIGLIFFVSAGSFLYFRVFTDVDKEKEKFTMVTKLGLKEAELKKIITQQLAILFFSPIVVALIHGAVALTALSHFFDYNLITESALVLGGFTVIQLLYFVLARHFYIKQVKRIL